MLFCHAMDKVNLKYFLSVQQLAFVINVFVDSLRESNSPGAMQSILNLSMFQYIDKQFPIPIFYAEPQHDKQMVRKINYQLF